MFSSCCETSNKDPEERIVSSSSLQKVVDAWRHVVDSISNNEIVVVSLSIVLLYTPPIFFGATAFGWYVDYNGLYIPILFITIAIIALSCFHIASLSDPGIIPKQKDMYDSYDAIRMKRKHSQVQSCIEVAIAGKFLRIKYCHTCNIYRPPRSVHCSVCDVCVHKFDHHCKWLGNCVGNHNYRIFYVFIFFTFIEIITLVTLSIIRIVVISTRNMDGSKIAESAGMIVYTFLSGWFIAGLVVYHTYLICTNKTTNEQLKSLYVDYNPWNRGMIRNFKESLMSKSRKGIFHRPFGHSKMIYDPGRGVPPFFKPTYNDSQTNINERRLAFDHSINESWQPEALETDRSELTTEIKSYNAVASDFTDYIEEMVP
ncbi:zinc finger DHHC domain containing protein [Babesia gibsoni]|uniref:Palmitoyltransferase n=1 Tax=Babesia gibsoni TaxID=33632 RepID=A0AAD8PCY7_BABGI|nr:zinc finger DHHC domain containing protein [Babesia gibsoni]